MQVIVPAEIDIRSTNVAASTEAEWSSSTTYSLNDLVKVTVEAPNKIYRSLRDNNTNRNPSDYLEPVTETGVSATSLTVGTGSHSLTVGTGLGFSPGMVVKVAKTNTPVSVNMTAEVTSYDSGTGALVVNTYSIVGSGTHAGWTITSVDEIGFWEEVSATNQWAMFDGYVNSQTVNEDSIIVALNVSNVDHVVLFGVEGTSVDLELWDEDATAMTWSKNIDLVYGSSVVALIGDWYEYFFGAYTLQTDISESTGILVQSSVLVVKINQISGEDAKCGTCLPGRAMDIGKTQYGVSMGMVDYSYRSEDKDTGVVTIEPGYYAKQNSMTVAIGNVFVDHVYKTVVGLRGTPTAWIGNNESTEYESLIVYGFFSDFDVILSGPTKSYASIEIKGLI